MGKKRIKLQRARKRTLKGSYHGQECKMAWLIVWGARAQVYKCSEAFLSPSQLTSKYPGKDHACSGEIRRCLWEHISHPLSYQNPTEVCGIIGVFVCSKGFRGCYLLTSGVRVAVSLKVQVPNTHILTQKQRYNFYSSKPKYLTIR